MYYVNGFRRKSEKRRRPCSCGWPNRLLLRVEQRAVSVQKARRRGRPMVKKAARLAIRLPLLMAICHRKS